MQPDILGFYWSLTSVKIKIKLKKTKKRNPLVEVVMKKGVRKHKNRKRDAKMKHDKRLTEGE